MKDFIVAFSKEISLDDTLILAVSGGVDSMVLLDLIIASHPKEKIIIAHYDHSLRGDESDGDARLVRDTCARFGVRYEMKKGDIEGMAKGEKMSIEALARRERYAFFGSLREAYAARYILTAHHRGDQAETILLNIIKGGKSRGLSGMAEISGYIFRPFLTIPKSAILAYAKEHDIAYREDSSNISYIYERNQIRHDILPRIREINPSIEETLSELGGYASELTEYLSLEVEKWLRKESENLGAVASFRVSVFQGVSVFFQKEIIATLYSRAHDGSTQGLSKGLIDELIRYIMTAEGSTEKSVGKLRLEKKKNQIYYAF